KPAPGAPRTQEKNEARAQTGVTVTQRRGTQDPGAKPAPGAPRSQEKNEARAQTGVTVTQRRGTQDPGAKPAPGAPRSQEKNEARAQTGVTVPQRRGTQDPGAKPAPGAPRTQEKNEARAQTGVTVPQRRGTQDPGAKPAPGAPRTQEKNEARAQTGVTVPQSSERRSGGDDFVADGVEDEFGEGVEIELEHDVGAMSFGGVDADAEEVGDLLVALAFGEELEDLAFARSEAGTRAFCWIGGIGSEIFGSDDRGDAEGEVGLFLADGINSGEEDAAGVIFQDVAASSGFDDLLNELVGFMHGEDKDLGVGRGLANAAGGVHAIQKGHANIEDGDIGLEPGGFFDGVAAVNGFGANLPALARFQESAQAGTNDGVIIRDQDAKGRHRMPPWKELQRWR